MNFLIEDKSSCDTLVLGAYEDGKLTPAAQVADELNQGLISSLIKSGDFKGKMCETTRLFQVADGKRLVLVGLGKELNKLSFKKVVAAVANTLGKTAAKKVAWHLNEVSIDSDNAYWNTRLSVEAICDALYVFDDFKSEKSTLNRDITFVFDAEGEQGLTHGLAIAKGVAAAKDLANNPPNICNPSYLAQKAQELSDSCEKISLDVIGEKEMKELGMNSYLAVGRGSKNESKMSVISYKNHPNPDAAPIVLVGKGLTFDSGGISLKPGAGMDEMKYDMGGAASVFGAMTALEDLQLPLNVIGVLAGCENMPDGDSYRPGDIIKTMNGLTVEVLNTDAEGRMVLCDALTYVERFKPEFVIDLATLTGACVVALGGVNSGLMTEDEELCDEILSASKKAAEQAWRLPVGGDYLEQLKSPFADLANIGTPGAGATTAGSFLSRFTTKYRWAHIDIAGTAWKGGAAKGATGRPVALLTQIFLDKAKA